MGNKRKTISAPIIEREILGGSASYLLCLIVDDYSLPDSLIFKMKPRASPMNPPKVKIPNDPKLSTARLLITCLLTSYPTIPNIVMIRHSSAPALPITHENATIIEMAHLKHEVMVLAELPPVGI